MLLPNNLACAVFALKLHDKVHCTCSCLLLVIQTNSVALVRFEVFPAVTMRNSVFWDVTPCGSCKNRRFGGT
jgi:hypothetical protein